ncbi:hypothetical protein I5R65_08070 [Herbaspirillum sp. AP02]|uniref:hypothetical protein n=1 Tax=unclassified Herbaspirillum TaxID=2624150 RepID=UPI0015DA6929|nr:MULTISPECIES: hypothetical protein [unclassified Herbaspirillum]MBG7619418.1 hypothetical protein [Herbaspirillum sp. AP02]NZD66702.1 hypothetical protein [Herbaspirillum sp. AP21]
MSAFGGLRTAAFYELLATAGTKYFLSFSDQKAVLIIGFRVASAVALWLAPKMPNICGIFQEILNQSGDPLPVDCDGDYRGCIGEIEADRRERYGIRKDEARIFSRAPTLVARTDNSENRSWQCPE